MSLEQAILANTEAVNRLCAILQTQGAQVTTSAPAPAAPPVAAPIASAPSMPAPPNFAPSAPAPAQQSVPFSDSQGLTQYTMAAYQAMGPEKGARIQSVLQSIGVSNLNEVKPEQFAAFYNGVEALKAGA